MELTRVEFFLFRQILVPRAYADFGFDGIGHDYILTRGSVLNSRSPLGRDSFSSQQPVILSYSASSDSRPFPSLAPNGLRLLRCHPSSHFSFSMSPVPINVSRKSMKNNIFRLKVMLGSNHPRRMFLLVFA